MKPTAKYSLIAAAVIIVGGVMFVKMTTKKDQANSNPEAMSSNKVATTPILPKANGESTASAKAVVEKELPANPYLTKESMASMPVSMKQFLLLDMKSIKNTEETKKFYGLLRSPAAINDAQKILLSVKPQNIAESEREHFAATRFMARAMGDLNNQSNKALNEMIKKIILEDNISSAPTHEAKMIFAGDKAELTQTYLAFNQNAHQELMANAKNPSIKKIVQNAYVYNQSMRAGN